MTVDRGVTIRLRAFAAPSLISKEPPKARKPAMGKPKPLALSSFILLGVEAMMKLDGLALRSVWASLGKESAYLGIQRFVDKRGKQLSKTLKENLAETANDFPDSAWKTNLLKGLDGDHDAQDSINTLGQWETFRLGFLSSNELGLTIWIDHLVEIEKASRSVDLHLNKGEFAQAASLATETIFLRPYLTPAAIARLSKATSGKDALVARAAGLCEVLLSQIARVDCLPAIQANFEDGFSHLTHSKPGQPIKPGRQFFVWIKGMLGVKTLAELQTLVARDDVPVIDESTIKRWNSGREFPRAEKLNQFIAALESQRASVGGERLPSDRIYLQYWAARRLQKLLDLARLPWEEEGKAQGHSRPWSEMMEHDSAEAWIQARFRFWQGYWKDYFQNQALKNAKKG